MNNVINIRRGEVVAIAFTITDDVNNALLNKRVTYSFTDNPPAVAPASVLLKASGMGASSADVAISSQTANQIKGTINLKVADYTALPKAQYAASLWIDDGNGNDRCVSTDVSGAAAGYDVVNIMPTSPRT